MAGKNIKIKLPNGEVRAGQFALVELDDLIASHNERTFSPSKGYPTNASGDSINDRNYSGDKTAQAKIIQIAQNLDPDRLIVTSRTANGTPIVVTAEEKKIGKENYKVLDHPKYIVISGNNRTMSLKLAKKDYPDRFAEYQDFLEEEIDVFGLSNSDLKKFKNPIIVRFDFDVAKLNTTELSKYNQDEKKSERPIDKAIKLGNLIDENQQCKSVISNIVGKYETFSEFYQNYRDEKAMFSSLTDCNVITKQDQPKYFSEIGFNKSGKELIENLLAGMILSKKALIAAEELKSYKNIIITSLPVLISNDSFKEESLKKSINEAFEIESKIRSSGLDFSSWINQKSLFEEAPDRKSLYLNRLLSTGRNNFKKSVEKYNESIKNNQEENLFGNKPTQEEIFETHIVKNIPEKYKKEIDTDTTDTNEQKIRRAMNFFNNLDEFVKEAENK